MIYSEKHKFVYMPVPKTGTTTLSSVLFEDFEAKHWDFNGIVPIRKNIRDKKGIWPKHIIHLPKELEKYFVFSTIRNPYRHVMSQYWNFCFVQKQQTSMKGFQEWLELVFIESFYNLLKISDDYQPPKGCVKFKSDVYIDVDEKISDQFNLLPFVKKPIMLPHLKRSIKNGLFYTEEMAALVVEKRKIDFDYFGYSYELPEDLRKPCLQ